MRWSTYLSRIDATEHVALAHDGAWYVLPEPHRLIDLLGDDGQMLEEAAKRARTNPLEIVDVTAELRAPIPVPPSIRDFMAFEDHVNNSSKGLGRVLDHVWYEQPLFYFTNPAATLGPYDPVPVAPGSQNFDYELEIAAVVGKGGSNLNSAEADKHIAGYMLICDWSARDLQSVEMRGNLGPAKSKDTATSFGQFLVTPDELADRRSNNAYDLEMTASVNGSVWSRGNMSSMYWSFGELLAYASRGTGLRPGDIVASGTVGTGCILELRVLHGNEKYPWLQVGDDVRLEIERLGVIDTTVVHGSDVIPLR